MGVKIPMKAHTAEACVSPICIAFCPEYCRNMLFSKIMIIHSP